jgi:hypothetical protein
MSTQEPINSLFYSFTLEAAGKHKVTYNPLKLNLALPENTDCNIYKPI